MTQMKAEDLLAKMREGVKATHEITMRGVSIPVRVLSVDEMNRVRRDGITQAVLAKGDDVDKNVHIQKVTLMLASTPAITGGVPFLTEKVLGMLSMDEVNYLYNEYIVVLDSVNPAIETISSEAFNSLVDALKKNLVSASDLSLRQLRAICSAYADLLNRTDSPTGSSSGSAS